MDYVSLSVDKKLITTLLYLHTFVHCSSSLTFFLCYMLDIVTFAKIANSIRYNNQNVFNKKHGTFFLFHLPSFVLFFFSSSHQPQPKPGDSQYYIVNDELRRLEGELEKYRQENTRLQNLLERDDIEDKFIAQKVTQSIQTTQSADSGLDTTKTDMFNTLRSDLNASKIEESKLNDQISSLKQVSRNERRNGRLIFSFWYLAIKIART
jgi:hypothetical protein